MAEVELVDFKFKGPGWYNTPGTSDWMLVLDYGEGRFRFCIYSYDPRPALEALAKLPLVQK